MSRTSSVSAQSQQSECARECRRRLSMTRVAHAARVSHPPPEPLARLGVGYRFLKEVSVSDYKSNDYRVSRESSGLKTPSGRKPTELVRGSIKRIVQKCLRGTASLVCETSEKTRRGTIRERKKEENA